MSGDELNPPATPGAGQGDEPPANGAGSGGGEPSPGVTTESLQKQNQDLKRMHDQLSSKVDVLTKKLAVAEAAAPNGGDPSGDSLGRVKKLQDAGNWEDAQAMRARIEARAVVAPIQKELDETKARALTAEERLARIQAREEIPDLADLEPEMLQMKSDYENGKITLAQFLAYAVKGKRGIAAAPARPASPKPPIGVPESRETPKKEKPDPNASPPFNLR